MITPLEKSNIKQMVLYGVRYCIAMGTALFIGAALFLPSVIAMSDGKGSINWSPIFGVFGWGNIFSFIQRLEIGSKSEYGNPAFYCGSMAVLGCMIGILCKKAGKEKENAADHLSVICFISVLYSGLYMGVLFVKVCGKLLVSVWLYWNDGFDCDIGGYFCLPERNRNRQKRYVEGSGCFI